MGSLIRKVPFVFLICRLECDGDLVSLSAKTRRHTVIGGPQGKGRDGDILSYRSIDGGKNWFGPVKVNDVDDSAREGLHAMAASDDGTLWCVWLDLREKGMQLFAAKSVDQGLHGARINWCIGRKVEAFASVVILRFWPTRTRCMSCSETRSRVTETCILFPPKIAGEFWSRGSLGIGALAAKRVSDGWRYVGMES